MRASEREFQMALDNLNKVLPVIAKAGPDGLEAAVATLSTEDLLYFGSSAFVVGLLSTVLTAMLMQRPDSKSELARLTQAAKERRAQDPDWREDEPSPTARPRGIYG